MAVVVSLREVVNEMADCKDHHVAYLNRAGASVLPVIGIAYDTDSVKYELVFPRPRAAWMLSGSVKDHNCIDLEQHPVDSKARNGNQGLSR